MQNSVDGRKLCNLELDLGEWSMSVVCKDELAAEAAKLNRNDRVIAKGVLKRNTIRTRGVETIIYFLQATELCPALPNS
jgi:hypothetical protein